MSEPQSIGELVASINASVPQTVDVSRIVSAAPTREQQLAKIATFNGEMRKGGKQLTPETKQRAEAHADQLRFATALAPHLDKDGRVSSEVMNACAPLLSEYRLPAGVTVNAQSVYMMLQVARKAGFTQAHVDAYIKAELELGMFA